MACTVSRACSVFIEFNRLTACRCEGLSPVSKSNIQSHLRYSEIPGIFMWRQNMCCKAYGNIDCFWSGGWRQGWYHRVSKMVEIYSTATSTYLCWGSRLLYVFPSCFFYPSLVRKAVYHCNWKKNSNIYICIINSISNEVICWFSDPFILLYFLVLEHLSGNPSEPVLLRNYKS